MDIRFQAGGEDKWSADIALVPIWEGEKILETCPELGEAAPFLQIAPGMRDVAGRDKEISIVYGHPDLPYSRVMFIGLGKQKSGQGVEGAIREAFARAVRRVRTMHLTSVHIPFYCFRRLGNGIRLLEEAVYACVLANHEITLFKQTTRDELLPRVEWLAVGFRDEFVPDQARVAARRGETAALAVNRARDLANTPGNILFPDAFASKVQLAARERGVRCEVLDEQNLEREGFGAHLAVGRGGAHPPRLVVLEYAPKGHEDEQPLVLVGKGITFDSGGLSLKPSARMHLMKSDMTGAAATFAALMALAEEEVPHRVVGLLALAENMPDGNATRPGDVVTGLSGDRIEIVNTDAEGRLVLCDALTYAQKRWNPAAVVDVATLTGACAVALGDEVAGLFCNDTALAERVISAGHCAGENYWQLPLWPGYRKKLTSPVADICHTSSSREGGAITAALYLEHFIQDDTLWAHLDIAGVDWSDEGSALCSKGATGFATRTLLELGRGGLA